MCEDEGTRGGIGGKGKGASGSGGGGGVDNKVGEKKDIDTIERIQRKTTKIILELRDVSYEERIKECGLTTPEKKRLRGN